MKNIILNPINIYVDGLKKKFIDEISGKLSFAFLVTRVTWDEFEL